MIMGVYLCGWLGTELTVRVAVIAGSAVLGLSWGRLHRLSVGSQSAELLGDA
jgi:hypothetical protein